jgi:hypothetical protein
MCIMSPSPNLLTAARAEALFTSHLSAYIQPTRTEITDAISTAIRTHGGTRGCAIEVAAEYGEHPETAAPRMCWALAVIEAAYLRRPAQLRRTVPRR